MRAQYEELRDEGSACSPGLRGGRWFQVAGVATGIFIVSVALVNLASRTHSQTHVEQPEQKSRVSTQLISSPQGHAVTVHLSHQHPVVQDQANNHNSPTVPELSILSYNEYTKEQPISHSPWPLLAEPFRASTLEVVCLGACGSNAAYKWVVDNTVFTGQLVEHTYLSTGWHSVSLTMTDQGGGVVLAQVSTTIMVKYVRREIRSLTDDDRVRFLDAMGTLYRIPTTLGQAMYGPSYRGIEYFVAEHLQGAGVPECDHWHDDAGIMTHHVGFTLEFEQALQVVDPMVTIPYWEYTLDEYLYDTPEESPIFQDDWLGEVSPDNVHHTITKGRWAYTPVATDAWDSIHNPYGLLRSSWNTDPTPYITRHRLVANQSGAHLPTCQQLSKAFNFTTVATINQWLNGKTHGPVHVVIGGEWAHPDLRFLEDYGISDRLVLTFKSLWRRGYARTPTTCAGKSAADCKVSCPAEVMAHNNLTAYHVLLDSKAFLWLAPLSKGKLYFDQTSQMYRVAGREDDPAGTDKVFRRLLGAVCNPGYVGEMFTSAAPYDPTFWVIHPSADRFLAWRRLVASQEGTAYPLDESWGYDHLYEGATVPGDMGEVCSTEELGPLDLPSCVPGPCYGHNPGDVLPHKIRIDGVEQQQFTNMEFYEWMHPWNDELPYMYDSYKWPWCEAQGYYLGE